MTLTAADFQARVEAVIGMLERLHDRQYPLRSIPMDLVAQAVTEELRASDLEAVTPYQIAQCLNLIMARNMLPGYALQFASDPSQFDVASPWQASSFVPHEGAERLRDGG